MEHEQIIEDIDSLWFFSNILSPPKLPSVSFSTDENIITTQNPTVSDSESDKVQCESYTDSQFEISASESEYSETESEVLEELGSLRLKTAVAEADIMEKKEEANRRYTRGNEERFDFRDLGFDFRDIGFDSIIIPMMPKLPKSGDPYLICKMPPLSDGMAMKKHLKLWAHAVACTVK